MPDGTEAQADSSGGNQKLILLVLTILGALGAGGGGSWLATNNIESNIETTIQTRLATIEVKLENWQMRLSDKIGDIETQQSAKTVAMERKIEKLEEILRQSQQDSKLTDIHLELLEKIGDMDRSLSERLTRLEVATTTGDKAKQ